MQKEVEDIADIEKVVPNCLQMGWCESPHLFCSASEMERDGIEELMKQESLPAHKFEKQMFDETYNDGITPISNATSKEQLLHIS